MSNTLSQDWIKWFKTTSPKETDNLNMYPSKTIFILSHLVACFKTSLLIPLSASVKMDSFLQTKYKELN